MKNYISLKAMTRLHTLPTVKIYPRIITSRELMGPMS